MEEKQAIVEAKQAGIDIFTESRVDLLKNEIVVSIKGKPVYMTSEASLLRIEEEAKQINISDDLSDAKAEELKKELRALEKTIDDMLEVPKRVLNGLHKTTTGVQKEFTDRTSTITKKLKEKLRVYRDAKDADIRAENQRIAAAAAAKTAKQLEMNRIKEEKIKAKLESENITAPTKAKLEQTLFSKQVEIEEAKNQFIPPPIIQSTIKKEKLVEIREGGLLYYLAELTSGINLTLSTTDMEFLKKHFASNPAIIPAIFGAFAAISGNRALISEGLPIDSIEIKPGPLKSWAKSAKVGVRTWGKVWEASKG